MDRKIIERGAMTSTDVLALLAGERSYGAPDLTTSAIFEQSIPKGFQPMMDEIRSKLELPKLDASADHVAIWAAYGHDITLLESCRTDFKAFIDSATRASIVRHESITIAGRDMTIWEYLESHMPAMAQVSLVDISAEIAAWPESELLPHLTSEVDRAVTMLFKIICLWLDTLVTREFVGLLKITGGHTARYHYFRPTKIERVLAEKNARTEIVAFDSSKPYGKRTQYEKRADATVEITHGLERHDHDIVNMQVHTIAEYPDALPLRVVGFLDKTPEFVRRHLRIVSGMIIREQIHKRTTDVENREAVIVKSTWLLSPAITLADVYAPVGWSGRDMEKGPIGYFSGQSMCPPPPNRWKKVASWFVASPRRIVIGSLVTASLAVLAGIAITFGIHVAAIGGMLVIIIAMIVSLFLLVFFGPPA